MITSQFILPIAHELIIDLFAGGGGASTGIELAVGRHVDIAINHDPDAVGMHEINHPQTEHYLKDVWDVDPLEAVQGRRVGLMHASPDCTHHSQAKGGQPRDQEIRSLAWVVPKWLGKLKKKGLHPGVFTLENVEQMLQWSPLIAKRDPATGRIFTLDKVKDPITGKSSYRVAAKGECVPRRNQFLVPDPKRKGRNWRHFTEHLRGLGFQLQWKVVVNADWGCHSTRERLYVIGRSDGQPIVWPAFTHAKKPTKDRKAWRPAHECIDWSIKGRSIFRRERPLADATMRRIAVGMQRFVLDSPDPFIVDMHVRDGGGNTYPERTAPTLLPLTHQGGHRNHDPRQPLPTVTGANRGEQALAAATLVPVTHTRDVAFDVRNPFRTITAAKGGETALACATLIQTGYGEREGQAPRVLDLAQPLGTVMAGGVKHSVVTAHMTTLRKHSAGRDARDPLAAITAGGEHQALVEYHLSQEQEEGALRCAAFLLRYHANGGQWADLRDPATTITTHDRLALVTVWLKGEPWVIVDICLRMLVPRELYNAQDFPSTYVIDRTSAGKLLTKTAQVHMCGNSVSPLPMNLIVAANYQEAGAVRRAA